MVLGMNAIPELLMERREEAGLSQRAVARKLGVSPQTYVWWERGAVTPKATAAGELAEWLGLTKGDILVLTEAQRHRIMQKRREALLAMPTTREGEDARRAALAHDASVTQCDATAPST